MGYAAGYALAMTSWVQMAVMCYTGQNVVDRVSFIIHVQYFMQIKISFYADSFLRMNNPQNDNLVDIYYNFKWYLLPNNDQKYIISMIHRMQNGIDLTIGPLEQLNYETLKIVSIKILLARTPNRSLCIFN